MQFFVMRHGQASPYGSSDSSRELTQHGVAEVKAMANWLNQKEIFFDTVFVSPFIRAQQTANILVDELSHQPEMKTLSFITPSGNARDVHDYLDGVSNVEKFENVLIVSHMPLVSYLVAELTEDYQSPIFQTAAIAQIHYDVTKMKGQLTALTSPSDIA